MKEKIVYIFWAIVFLLVGIGSLAGYFDLIHSSLHDLFVVYMVASGGFIISYLLVGIRKWGWLLPALVLAGMAVDISPEFNALLHVQPNGVPIMASIAVWFIIGYLINRKHWWLLIPAYILILAAVETAINTSIPSSFLHGASKSTFLVAYSSGAGIMFLLSVPFFVVYFMSKKSWWSLIPAVGLTGIGMVVALQALQPDRDNSLVGIYTGSLLLVFAAIFGVLWLRRKVQPTSWALYPAVGLCALAILSFTLGNGWNTLTDPGKAIFFAVVSAISFVGYFIHGLRKWGWLFPALFCAALAITMWMSINQLDDSPWMDVPILLSVALPFYVGFAIYHKHRGLLIPAVIISVVAAITLISDTRYEEVGVFAIFALPFFVVYVLSKKSWWAFIPAGIFASFALMLLLDTLIPHEEYPSLPFVMSWDSLIWVLFLGVAVTFGVLWLRRKTQPTD